MVRLPKIRSREPLGISTKRIRLSAPLVFFCKMTPGIFLRLSGFISTVTSTTKPTVQTRAVLLAATLAAGWPVVRWYVERLHDGSDEPLGFIPLVAALLFAPRDGWRDDLSAKRTVWLLSLMVGYVLGWPFLPPLARAAWWVWMIGVVAAPKAYKVAWIALLGLSLPLVATLQFYAGYPLRCVVTRLAALVLNGGGVHVTAEATVLNWSGERVLIDAPCSGLQMTWTMLLAASVLACACRLDTRGTLRLFRRASGLVLAANVLRAVAIFAIEMKLCPRPPLGHEGVGLALFALAALGLLVGGVTPNALRSTSTA